MKILIVAFLSLVAMKTHTQAVEAMPEYPGGMEALLKFLQRNLIMPREARNVEGKVFIGFIVNEDGSLSDFKVVMGVSEAIDICVLETFMKMPNWIPACNNNRPIRSNMVVPLPIHSHTN